MVFPYSLLGVSMGLPPPAGGVVAQQHDPVRPGGPRWGFQSHGGYPNSWRTITMEHYWWSNRWSTCKNTMDKNAGSLKLMVYNGKNILYNMVTWMIWRFRYFRRPPYVAFWLWIFDPSVSIPNSWQVRQGHPLRISGKTMFCRDNFPHITENYGIMEEIPRQLTVPEGVIY